MSIISLGVDCSSSVCAWAFVEGHDTDDWKLMDVGHVSLAKMDELDRFDLLKQTFASLRYRNPDRVVLEQAVYGYGMATNAKTLCGLHRSNALCHAVLYQTFLIRPTQVTAQGSRKWLTMASSSKEEVFQTVTERLVDTYTVTYKKSKKTPLPPRDHHFDEVDAIVLSVSGLPSSVEASQARRVP